MAQGNPTGYRAERQRATISERPAAVSRDHRVCSHCGDSEHARRDMVARRVAIANQLRAHLQIVFPPAACLFASLDSAISLKLLDRFTT